MKEKFDIYRIVTDRIIEQLEQGVVPWQKPWSGTYEGAVSHSTGKPYSLLNQLLLGKSGEYLTFNQVQAEGGKIKKGAKASFVTFWKMYPVEEENKDGEIVKKVVPLLRYYKVFHISDCEGIEPKLKEETHENEPIQSAETIIKEYTARENTLIFKPSKSDSAYYNRNRDCIVVPLISQYTNVEEYYSTAFHEMVHSTGHKSRLDRFSDNEPVYFGSDDYSKEELVAEIGAAALVNIAGVESRKSFNNSTAYIASWLNALKNDKKLIVSAASKAEKALKYILGDKQEN